MGNQCKNITRETADTVIEGISVSEIAYEIKDYYAKHKYGERMIPFSAETIKKIAEILESGNIPKEDAENYDENMSFEILMQSLYENLNRLGRL